MDNLPESIDSKFRYILVAAVRAEQLTRGAKARVEVSSTKPARIAMEEIGRGLVEWDYGPRPEASVADAGDDASEAE